ncbi:MAG: hypothetical protein HY927_10195 [Elusimicrobia bacterium]|nr:hypothetical protein [Elusimicrobiota bacterium]
MSQGPDIRPEVNKEEEEKKRGAALLSFGEKLGGQAFGGAGGLGGGLLATKAGIIGLALVGSTIAAGVGWMGYKAMAPESPASNTFSIFEAKPKTAESADGSASGSASADGTSNSLDMFAKANTSAEGGQASEAPPPVDPAVKTADSASSKGSAVDHGNSTLSGPAANAPKASLAGKIGGLSGSSGGGGSAANFSAGTPGGTQLGNTKGGKIKGMSGASGPRTSGGLGKALARSGGRFRGMGFARNIVKDNRGAASSMAAGRTYDNNRANASTFGTGAGVPEAGAPTGDAKPDTLGGPDMNASQREQLDIPQVEGPVDFTPWSKEIDQAKQYLMYSAGLLFLAATIFAKGSKTPLTGFMKFMLIIMCLAAAALAVKAMIIGFQILGGKWGQGTLGTIFALSGGLLTATAIGLMFDSPEAEGKGELMASMPTWLMVCGVGGLAGMLATTFFKDSLVKKAKCADVPADKQESDEVDKQCLPPTAQNTRQGAPSERILDRFLVS